MGKRKTKFVCQTCGYETPKWMGKCPGCMQWNTMVEELEEAISNKLVRPVNAGAPIPLSQIKQDSETRIDTQIQELNRVLGGGLVEGSFVLVGGDPGIGKSTLLIQLAHRLAQQGKLVLYVSGEESVRQIQLRAQRLKIENDRIMLLAETDLEKIDQIVTQMNPTLLIIDSIQTMVHPNVASAPGSVAQVRECTSYLLRIAKSLHIATILVGHVTKQGEIAGPRILEHMVDTVLYFEGDQNHSYRLLRSVKNRFGSTHEMGIFEMKEYGLKEVTNPSEMFLSERPYGVAGSSIVATMEGSRPLLIEIQALLSPTIFPSPRRMATGIDYNRIAMIMAVLEKRVGLLLQNQDAYVNVVGGVRIDEPATDLAVAVSIASSFRDRPTLPHDVLIGEIGLTGEIRGVPRIEQRVYEAQKMGFKRVIIPKKNTTGVSFPQGIEIIPVETLSEALKEALGG
jgi:DNA repair protein RadA/Sms